MPTTRWVIEFFNVNHASWWLARLSIAVCVAFTSSSAEAQLYLDAQYGSDTPLAGFRSVLCGAAFNGVASPRSCPGGQQGNGASTNFTAANLCPNPDAVGCRFSQVPAPPSANDGWTPSDKVLQVRVGNGDNDPPGLPWGSGPRNELSFAIDHNSVLAVSTNQQDLGHYSEGDDRWFGWATYIPSAPLFHDPPFCTNGAEGTTFFQIHEEGQCVGGGPLLMLALRRTDVANPCHSPYQAGPDWMPVLTWKSAWSGSAPNDNCFQGLPNSSPINGGHLPECNIRRLWPKAGANPAFARDTWHTFQLHVKFSANPSIGVLELWVDETKVYPNPADGDPTHQTTLFNWTNPPQCSLDPATTGPMPVYVNQGMYGLVPNGGSFDYSDLIYQADLKIGGTRQDVDPIVLSSYSVATAPSQVSTVQGDSSSVSITVAPINGFAGTVFLSASGLPQGASASFNPSIITTSGSAALTLDAGTAAAGSYAITITGTSGSLHPSTSLAWTISGSSSNGPLWVQQAGSPADDYGYGLATDASGNVYLTGYSMGHFTSQYGGGRDAITAKFSSAGALAWAGQLTDPGDSFGRAIAVDPSGNVYVAGSTTDALWDPYQGGLDDAFLARWNANTSGAEAFSLNIGTSGDDIAYGVATDAQGNVYVTGTTNGAFPGATNAGGYDVFLAKFDPNGTRLWVEQAGSSGDDIAYAIAIDQSGNAVLAGTTTGNLFGTNAGGKDLFLLKTDPNGKILWSTQRGTAGDDIAQAVAVDPSGFIYVAGSTTGSLGFNYTNTGGFDAFLFQYTASGSIGWSRQLGANTDDEAYGVATDVSGNVYLAGYTTGSLAGPSAGGYDALVAKYDTNGNRVWASQIGGAGDEIARAVAVSGTSVYVVGGTTGSILGAASRGGKDVFVAKYDAASGGGLSFSWPGNPSNPSTYPVTISDGPTKGQQQQAYSYSVGGWTTIRYDGAEEASSDGIALGPFQQRWGYQFKRNYDGTQTPSSSYYSDPMGPNPAPGGVTWGPGDTATIFFSLYLPASTFPIGSPSNRTGFGYGIDEWALFQQFHSLSQPGVTIGGVVFTATRSDSIGGILYVNRPNHEDGNHNAAVLWSTPLPDARDRWWDFAMTVTFGANGHLVLYVNGSREAEYFGTIYDPSVPDVRWNVTQDLYRKSDLPTATIYMTPIMVQSGAYGASQ